MKEYQIFRFDDDTYDKVVLITCTEDLYFIQDTILEDFSAKYENNFTILIDLFLRNGYSFNRFVGIDFISNGNYKSYIINPRNVSDNIKNKLRNYLKSNESLLTNSALSIEIVNFVKQANP